MDYIPFRNGIYYDDFMPLRKEFFETNNFYHIFNRGFKKQNIYLNSQDYKRFSSILEIYPQGIEWKFSYWKLQGIKWKQAIIIKCKIEEKQLVEIIAYCLMPNHFHLLVKQQKDEGIRKFMTKLSNSYAHYFNVKHNQSGPVFEGRFKAVKIESNEQLLHVSRYIHLNPYSAEIIKKKDDLINYDFFSLKEYLNKENRLICNPAIILKQFSNLDKYLEFVIDNADYQQSLQRIKKLIID